MGLVPNGISQYIVGELRGIATEGNVRRAYDDLTESQYVIVNLVAAIPTLTDFENKVLNSEYWNWETVYDEPRSDFSSRQFVILTSYSGAVCGENSNPEYDHVSLKSRSSKSEISSTDI